MDLDPTQRLMAASAGLALTLFLGADARAGTPSDDACATPSDTTCRCAPARPSVQRQPMDLALCLDTSGSMDGLLDSAKERLWSLVNELARAEPLPDLRVALLTYGNDGYDAEDGWVRLDVPLTRDLDTLSEHLFALSTHGGTELVGRVVGVAHGRLDWSPRDDALKLIVVAGNESADQDRLVTSRAAAQAARATGVQVNAIYCGNPDDEDSTSWREVSALAHGRFACIEADGGTVAMATPFDARLTELSARLNETYLPFGEQGAWGLSNQALQDSNAQTLNSTAVASRAVSKAGKLYRCSWDLVDALADGSVVLEDLAADELPEALVGLDAAGRVAHVERLARDRAALQASVRAVDAERQAWLVAERARLALDGSRSLDDALCDAVRAQARAKGFVFAGDDAADASGGAAVDAGAALADAPGVLR